MFLHGVFVEEEIEFYREFLGYPPGSSGGLPDDVGGVLIFIPSNRRVVDQVESGLHAFRVANQSVQTLLSPLIDPVHPFVGFDGGGKYGGSQAGASQYSFKPFGDVTGLCVSAVNEYSPSPLVLGGHEIDECLFFGEELIRVERIQGESNDALIIGDGFALPGAIWIGEQGLNGAADEMPVSGSPSSWNQFARGGFEFVVVGEELWTHLTFMDLFTVGRQGHAKVA